MHKKAHQAIIRGAAMAGLTMLLVAPAMSQQQRGQRRAAIHQRCVSRSAGT